MTLATLSIVSHGHGVLLTQALDDLSRQRRVAECRIVVTLNLVDEVFDPAPYEGLRLTVLRNSRPKGFGANHNAAFAHCDSPWFVVLNPDIRMPGTDALEALVATLPAQVHGLTAPLVTNSAGVPEDSVRSNLTPASLVARAFGHRKRLDVSRPASLGHPFFWLAGMCLVVNAEAYREVHGFDERFFLYCEDYDLCARLYSRGYSLVVDETVQVIHDAQRDSHRSRKHLRWHLESLLRVWLSAAFWRVVRRG